MSEVTKELSVFETLNKISVSDKTKEKNGLTYLSWASAWAEVKKCYPDASFRIIPQTIDAGGNTRPWHDDGRSGWVEVGVTINGQEIIETLAVMDHRNKAIAAGDITSTEANKSIKRCLVKAIAMHGLGLYIYEGEDMPEELSKAIELREEIMALISKKCAQSEKAKAQVGDICKAAEREANPLAGDDEITGNPRNIEDIELLEKLKRQLMAVRK